MTASETMTEYENMKKMLESVQSRLEEAEQTILEGENLRKKLHNTILVWNSLILKDPVYINICYVAIPEFGSLQELKGNIRVFCRVRPLLPNESGAVSYPKNGENLGRGIELLHNGRVIITVIFLVLNFDILYLRIQIMIQLHCISYCFQHRDIRLLLIKYLIIRRHKNMCS